MTTREQDHAIEELSYHHSGAAVRVEEGLEDGAVHATVNGCVYTIDRFGDTRAVTTNPRSYSAR